MRRGFATGLAIAGLFVLGAAAQGMRPGMMPMKPPAAKPAPVPKERTVVTHASVTINGQTIPYTATAGTLLLYNDQQKATASVFYIAYTKDGVSDPGARPVTFAYNGGPGGASALVDIGGFGPRRIEWPAPGYIAGQLPPYQIVNNADSIFDSTDLVFVDAVGTGYSRIVGAGKPNMFYGINEDASTFAQFIVRYLKRNHRWNSPKFLLGESYGTTRNAVLAYDLVNQGVYLNGVIMCSTVLNFETASFGPGNDLPFEMYLPSYAAAAWYHHRLSPRPASLPALLDQVRAFAAGPYAAALFAGANLPAAQEQKVAQQLQQYTGIPAATWVKARLRINASMFRRRVMGAADEQVGRYDTRFTTPELQPLLPLPGQGGQGAASTAIMGALTAAFDNYLSDTLHYHSNRIYTQLSFAVNRQWDMRFRGPLSELSGGGAAPDVSTDLARAMNNDPGMHVLFNNGYYDQATPFFATEYTVAHMPITAAERAHISFQYYPVGHMLYLNPEAMPMLHKNIDAFIAASAPSAGK